MSLFGPSELPLVQAIIEGNQRIEREGIWRTTGCPPRRYQDEELRALALAYEEREAARAEVSACEQEDPDSPA